MSAKRFLELLEQNRLLDASIVDDLRNQLSKKPVSAETIAKALVDKGHLTRFQATELVGQATQLAEQKREAKATSKQKPADDELGLAPDDELGLAPDDDLPADLQAQEQPAEEEVVMLEPVESAADVAAVTGLTPVEDAGADLTPVAPAAPAETALAPLSDGLGDQAPADPFGADSGPAMLPTPRRRKRNVWDTKLMVGGGLALLILILLLAAVGWNLMAMPADERWELAMKDYRSESYSQAEAKFETFLEKFPKDDRASEARVRVALCKIRVVLSDPQTGLDRANELLPEIENEEAFALAREELATMLIQIPEGFLKRAQAAEQVPQQEEAVALTEQGMELINKSEWVPSSQRRSIDHRITALVEGISLVRRDINQDKELAAAISGINTSIQEQQPLQAYQTYKDLVDRYPGLARDEGLQAALEAVTASERELVRVTQEKIESTDMSPRQRDFRIVLASRSVKGSREGGDQVVAVLAGGSVYGLDAGTGEVLWGRFVGHGTMIHPVRGSSRRDADVLFFDGVRLELVCLAARQGKLKWRLPVGEPISPPLVSGQRAYVSLRSGKLLEVDLATGNSSRQVSVPLQLSVAAATSRNRSEIYQLADHSNLYALASDSLECQAVHYVGHQAGMVSVAPLIQMGHIFVAENHASNRCRVNVLRLPGEDTSLSVAQPPIELKGNVVVPLIAYGRRLMVVTDLGEVRVFDIDLNKQDAPPCTEAASLTSTLEQPLAAYPLTDASSLWMADNRLTAYRIQVTTGQITRQSVANRGDIFVGPLHQFGDLLVHTRRKRASAGVSVAAVRLEEPRKAVWQTDLAVPAGRVAVDPQKSQIHVISAAAALFEITEEAIQNGYNDEPAAIASTAPGSLSFTEQIEFPDGRVALCNPADGSRIVVYDPNAAGKRLRLLQLDQLQGEVTCLPVQFQAGLLTPSPQGEVLLIDISKGKNLVLPFRPKQSPGEEIRWRRPAVLGDQFVIIDEHRNIYRVGIKQQPQPFLDELAAARLDVQIDSDLAAAGTTVYGVARTGGGDVVVAIDGPDLQVKQEWDLEGRATWGPQQVRDHVLVVVDDERLFCFQAGQKLRWQTPARMHGRPAGPPLVDRGDYVFAGSSGTVWRISGDTGQELTKAEVGEPLGAGPVAFGSRLLLSGKAGALRVIPMPAGS